MESDFLTYMRKNPEGANLLRRRGSKKVMGVAFSMMREIYKRSFLRFYQFLYPDYFVKGFHRRIITLLLSKKSRILILLPRKCGKTTLVTVAYPLWVLLSDPNHRFLLVHANRPQAIKYLNEIKWHIESNVPFREIFGDMVGRKWSEEEIVVKTRTEALKDPSILTAGVEQGVTGGAYDTIILDDLSDQTNTETEEQMVKIYRYFQHIPPLLDRKKKGKIIVIGTIWNMGDYISRILRNHPEYTTNPADDWRIIDEEGNILFPERFTIDDIELMKREMGPEKFAAQMLNMPVPPDQRQFPNPSYFDVEYKVKRRFLAIDFSAPKKESAGGDYTGFVIVDETTEGDYVVVFSERFKGSTRQHISRVMQLLMKFGLDKDDGTEKFILYDSVGMEGIYLEEIDRRISTWGWNHINRIDIKLGQKGKSKKIKIGRLIGHMEYNRVFLRRGNFALEEEMTYYPKGAHDDIIDALATVVWEFPPSNPRLMEKTERKWRTEVDPELGVIQVAPDPTPEELGRVRIREKLTMERF